MVMKKNGDFYHAKQDIPMSIHLHGLAISLDAPRRNGGDFPPLAVACRLPSFREAIVTEENTMRFFISIFILGLAVSSLTPQPAIAAPSPHAHGISFHFGYFYNSLRPHGEWIELEEGFYVWRPLRVRHGWRPYMFGRWAWTNHGWYWISQERFGWIVFHYGRWYYDDYYGWVWVPDDVWGPSWVEWRYDDDYVGWAPLPPYAGFHISIGIRFSRHWDAPGHYWNFIRIGHFGREVRYRDVVSDSYTRRLIRTTRSSRDYDYRDNRVINRGLDPGFIERRTSRRMPELEITDRTSGPGEQLTRRTGSNRTERIEVYRPREAEIRSTPERVEARRSERRSTLELEHIERPDRNQESGGIREETRRPSSEQERPQIERRATPESRTPQIERTPRPATPGQSREQRPREVKTPSPSKKVETQQPQERRRELIQRYERSSPTPPTSRETPSVKKESRSSPTPAPAAREKRNSGGERRRD